MLSRYGVGPCILGFNILLFLGGSVNFLGVFYSQFWVMVVGRALFGLGAEGMIIAQSTMAEKWFAGKFLSFAIGLNCFIDFSSATLQDFILPQVFLKTRSLEFPYLVIIVVAFVGFLIGVTFYFLDLYAS